MSNVTIGINKALKLIGLAGFSGISVDGSSVVIGINNLLRTTSPLNKRVLAELRRQDLAHISKKEGKIIFGLTPAGAHRLQQISIDELTIPTPLKWDGLWRAVMFDVPVNQSRNRVVFANKLKALGFVMIQKSVWVHPYPCFKQVEKLASHYNVLRHCSLLEVRKFDELTVRRLYKHYPNKYT